jgi:hypothetical protein
MKTFARPVRAVGLVLLCCGATAASLAAVAPAPVPTEAGDRCEAAVADTIRRMRGADATEVEFASARRRLATALDNADQTAVKGEGRYRGHGGAAMNFSYSCAYDARTASTSGVVFRDTGHAGSSSHSSWQPDLSRFSPDACEAATAQALKDKYPRVGGIAFDAGTRVLQPAADDHTRLEGRGALVRAPGMNATPFGFRCEFDSGDGKVVSVHTHD